MLMTSNSQKRYEIEMKIIKPKPNVILSENVLLETTYLEMVPCKENNKLSNKRSKVFKYYI